MEELTTAYFQSLFEDMMDMIRDDRPMAVTAWQNGEYRQYMDAEEIAEEIVTDAELEFDEIDYMSWEERLDLEPGWTDGEEAMDTIEMAMYDAESTSDAQYAWEMVAYRNTK